MGLCTGELKNLSYTGTKFYWIFPASFIQGGDLGLEDGRGSDSVYGGAYEAEDNKLNFKHESHLLAMAKNHEGKVGS